MIISIEVEKSFDKIQRFKIKTLNKLGLVNYLNIIKAIYKKLIANIISNSERLFLYVQEEGKDKHSPHSYSTKYWKS